MDKAIARLQLITSAPTKISYFEQVKQFVYGGGNWVQLRMKDEDPEVVKREAVRCLSFCMENATTFILNDRVELAALIGADGVHLGKNDMSPMEARSILGPQAIIGGTANTFDDILRLIDESVDYIGLGPFRFTSTKKNLSPVLGIEGYAHIFQLCKEHNINIPIVAIGGLDKSDFKPLFDAGVHGVALSSAIVNDEQPGAYTLELLKEIGKCSSFNWTRLTTKK